MTDQQEWGFFQNQEYHLLEMKKVLNLVSRFYHHSLSLPSKSKATF